MSSIDEILAGYQSLQAGQEASHKDLHRHPELSHQEHRTALRVAERLRGNGFTIASGTGGTAVVGYCPTAAGPRSCSAASSAPRGSRSTRRSGVMAAGERRHPDAGDPRPADPRRLGRPRANRGQHGTVAKGGLAPCKGQI
jgi:hypothetical protein